MNNPHNYEVSVLLVDIASNMRETIINEVGHVIWYNVYNVVVSPFDEYEGGEGDTTRSWSFIIEDEML
jgi:hypothetical protein